jgi:hypothetical protein
MVVNAEEPVWVHLIEISTDYGQFYIYSTLPPFENDDDNAFLDALADAHGTRRFIGTGGPGGPIDVMTPSRRNQNIPMRVELWDVEPPTDTDRWDHEVDIDFAVPTGGLRVWFEASGGGRTASVEIPSGEYRTRISGSGYDASWTAGIEARAGHESFRMQLWRNENASPPILRKSWPGFDRFDDFVDYRRSGRKEYGTGPATRDTNHVREWLRGQGVEISDRGRIPSDLMRRYEAANPGR